MATPRVNRPYRRDGRPTKYTPTRVEAILVSIRRGVSVEGACQLAGITSTTFYEWSATRPDFTAKLKAAEAELEAAMVERVREAADSRLPGTWTAAMTLMERRFPSRWGRRDRVTHEHEGQVTLQIQPMAGNRTSLDLLAQAEGVLADDDLLALPPAPRALPPGGS